MYRDILSKSIAEGVHYFDVNTPLWTDGAAKSRYIAVPPGTSLAYDDTADAYGYPDGAMVIKNFAVDTVAGDPSSRILVETRFTALKKIGTTERWYLFTYRWRADQTDADLVPESGANATVPIRAGGPAGAPVPKKWRFPSVAQCAACHRNGSKSGRVVLAFFTAQINRPLAANPAVNQINHFFDIGLLASAAGRPDLSRSPRWARYDDESASLELRSRSYLAANCSGCHGQRGVASSATPGVNVDFDYHDLRVRTDLVSKRLFGSFPLDSAGLVVPGRPDRSVVLFRQSQRNQAPGDFSPNSYSMPPLGSYEPDTNALKVMTRWVAGLGPSAVHDSRPGPSGAIRVRDGRLYVPASLVATGGAPFLLDLRGRRVGLAKSGAGVYRIGRGAQAGLHLLVVDGRVLHRILL